jgi:tagaturonate reductase
MSYTINKLTYKALSGYDGYIKKSAPLRVVQFGEGNFLRAFFDYFIDICNEKINFNGKIGIVQPIAQGFSDVINEQEGLYTLYLRGNVDGAREVHKRVISAIDRAVNPYTDFDGFLRLAKVPELRYCVSNTTEAGICFDGACQFSDTPPASFPAKLTRFLYERFAAHRSGLIVLPCELIDENGTKLRACVRHYAEHWGLDGDFLRWLEEENYFCSTLVDRIVTGYPQAEAETLNKENGYEDKLLVVGEPFALWVIEAPAAIHNELPFSQAGLPVLLTDDHTPYKRRKVRILNGAHTALAGVALLCGFDTVGAAVNDALMKKFLDGVFQEIIPTLKGLDEADLKAFAAATFDRFANPFMAHKWQSIALNTTSKWQTRVLPSVLAYREANGLLPPLLTFSFASTLEMCDRFEITDSDDIHVLGERLKTDIAGFEAAVQNYRDAMRADGCAAALKALWNG